MSVGIPLLAEEPGSAQIIFWKRGREGGGRGQILVGTAFVWQTKEPAAQSFSVIRVLSI